MSNPPFFRLLSRFFCIFKVALEDSLISFTALCTSAVCACACDSVIRVYVVCVDICCVCDNSAWGHNREIHNAFNTNTAKQRENNCTSSQTSQYCKPQPFHLLRSMQHTLHNIYMHTHVHAHV